MEIQQLLKRFVETDSEIHELEARLTMLKKLKAHLSANITSTCHFKSGQLVIIGRYAVFLDDPNVAVRELGVSDFSETAEVVVPKEVLCQQEVDELLAIAPYLEEIWEGEFEDLSEIDPFEFEDLSEIDPLEGVSDFSDIDPLEVDDREGEEN